MKNEKYLEGRLQGFPRDAHFFLSGRRSALDEAAEKIEALRADYFDPGTLDKVLRVLAALR